MITLLIILVCWIGLGHFIWRLGLKYAFSSFKLEGSFFCCHVTGPFALGFLLHDIDFHPIQRTIDKYDPSKRTPEKDAFKQHVTNMEIEAGFELSYPEYAPFEYHVHDLEKKLGLR